MIVGNLTAFLKLDKKGFTKGLQEASRLAGSSSKSMNSSFAKAKKSANLFSSSLTGLGAAAGVATVGIAALAAGVAASVAPLALGIEKVEQYTRALKFLEGSSEEGAKANEFVKSVATELGGSIESLRRSYIKLGMAAKGTSFSQEEIRKLFIGTIQAGNVLGISNQQLEQSFYALSQMVAGDTIQLDELKNQLNEQLPGAMRIFAEGLGITTQEVRKLAEKGLLTTEETMKRFSDQLMKTFSGPSEEIIGSMTHKIGLLKLSINNMKEAFLTDSNLTYFIYSVVNTTISLAQSLDGYVGSFLISMNQIKNSFISFGMTISNTYNQFIKPIFIYIVGDFSSFAESGKTFINNIKTIAEGFVSLFMGMFNKVIPLLKFFAKTVAIVFFGTIDVIKFVVSQIKEEIQFYIDIVNTMVSFTQKAVNRIRSFLGKSPIGEALSEGMEGDTASFEKSKIRQTIDSFIGGMDSYLDSKLGSLKSISERVNKKLITPEVKEQPAFESALGKYKEVEFEGEKTDFKGLVSGAKEAQSELAKTQQTMAADLTNFLNTSITDGNFKIGSFMDGIVAKIQKIAVELLIVKPLIENLKNSFSGEGGSGGGGLLGKVIGMAGAFFGGGPNLSGPLASLKNAGVKSFASGGVISEPVVGIGMKSGSGYEIGERGPEVVTPIGKQGSGETKQTNNNFNMSISAMDSESFVDMINKNPNAIVGPIKDALRYGDKSLTSLIGETV